MLVFYSAALLTAATSLVSAANPCFNRDGSVASAYTQCPNSNFCCKKSAGGTCSTNGLCMDGNNLVNGSLALVNGQFFNQTGLYQSPACVNKNFDGCAQNCLTSMSLSSDTHFRDCKSRNRFRKHRTNSTSLQHSTVASLTFGPATTV
jgi:hypothetical protein